MREIKFRGIVEKDRDRWNMAGKFAYGLLAQNFDGEYMIATLTDTSHGVVYQHVDEESIGQFTGLTDKNGKEIYEGDIVKDYLVDNSYKVVFSESVGFCFFDEYGYAHALVEYELEIVEEESEKRK